MSMTLITGLVGIGMFVAFLGFLLVWVPAPPLIIIVAVVVVLLVYDFVNELRSQAKSGR